MFILKIVSLTGVERIRSAITINNYAADAWQGSRVHYQSESGKSPDIIAEECTVYVMSESGATLAKYVLGPSTVEAAKRQAAINALLANERKRDSAVVKQATFLLDHLLDPKVHCTANIRHAAEVLQREIDTWNRHCR